MSNQSFEGKKFKISIFEAELNLKLFKRGRRKNVDILIPFWKRVGDIKIAVYTVITAPPLPLCLFQGH